MKTLDIVKSAVIVMVLWLVACSAPTASQSAIAEYFTGDHGGGGELEIRWSAMTDRSLLGPAITQAADNYQLVGFSGTAAISRTLKPGVSNVLSLAPGVWRILVVAGLKRSSTATTVFLAGAANQDNVQVNFGERTSLNLVLRPVDTSFDVTTTGVWGDVVTVRATGKTRSPVVGVRLGEVSTDGHPRFRSTELWAGYKDAVVTGTPTDWSAEVTSTVPEGGTGIATWLVGSQLCLLDGTDTWVPTTGLLEGTWEWLNRADMTDTHPLAAESERHTATQAPPTGLSVSLGWE